MAASSLRPRDTKDLNSTFCLGPEGDLANWLGRAKGGMSNSTAPPTSWNFPSNHQEERFPRSYPYGTTRLPAAVIVEFSFASHLPPSTRRSYERLRNSTPCRGDASQQ